MSEHRSPTTVTAIVVNKDGAHHLRRCLSSLLAQTHPLLEIVLVDNASTDGSVDLVQREFPTARLIRCAQNVGFCAANNLALRATESDLVATLNNDAWVEPDWLANLVQAIQGDPALGSVASMMLFANRPETINSAGICLDPVGIAWDRLGGAPASAGIRAGEVDVFGACAGAALYRRAALDAVGSFDDAFFAYLDDVDLAWRLQLAGFGCRVVPTARAYHVHSATGVEGSPFKSYLLGRNKLRTIIKDYPSPQVLFFLPLIFMYDVTAVLYALLTRHNTAALRGRLAALRELPALLRQRRDVQARRQVGFTSLATLMAPLQDPLSVHKRYAHL